MTKFLTIYCDGAFSAKFSTTPSGETMDGTQKRMRPKMMARTTSITIQNLVEIARRTSAREDEMWCFSLFIFENNARRPSTALVRVELLPKDIASTVVGRFRWYLQRFFRKKSTFQAIEQFSKLSLGGATIGAQMAENFENVRKWAQSLCAPLRPFISEIKEKCYYSLLPYILQMCTRIKIFRYLVTGCHEKLSSSYRWYQKRTVGPTFVRTESLLSRAI